MRSPLTRIGVSILKIGGIVVASLLLLMFILPYLFPGFVSDKIRQWAKGSIKSEMNFSAARLSFFKHFPALTLTLYDFKLKGSEPFEKETLIEADEIALGVDLRSALSTKIRIDKIFLAGAFINIQVDTAGHANYNVYLSKPTSASAAAADTASASLQIKKILIEKSKLVYNDRSMPMLINVRDLYYRGSGDLSKDIFDLNTHLEAGSIDYYYGRQAYFVNKKINADLVTRINTQSLGLFFDKNDLTINQLPVVFTGRFEFLKDGYDMDFSLKSKSTESDLHDIFTAMPPAMLNWLNKTEVRGSGAIEATLSGQYIAARNIMPDLNLNVKIRDGYISNAQAPAPVDHLFLNLDTRLPGLNTDSLSLVMDSLHFNIGNDYFSALLRMKGMRQPSIFTRVRSEMDLEKWDHAFGLDSFHVKGIAKLDLQAEGDYRTGVIRSVGVRNTRLDTVVTSIPQFTLRSSLQDGYFKYASRPVAVDHIRFKLDASCAEKDYHAIQLALEELNATVLGNYIKGFFRLGNARDLPIDAGLDAAFHLSDLAKVYPLDSMELGGDLNVHVQTKGNYVPAQKLFPVTVASLHLDNGQLQTKYYPHPLEKIQVSARVTSHSGSLRDLEISLTPVSFLLEGQPFLVKADLQDLEDLRYTIVSKGLLDIGKIAKVFAMPGYAIRGLVETDLSLKGRQSDAVAGRYNLLFNSGTMKVKDVQVSSELFPKPFTIRTGLFRFDQDKMWFDTFRANYGQSDLMLNGYLSNVIDYAMGKGAVLKGSFDLKSDYILADEFMAYAGAAGVGAKPSGAEAVGGQTGGLAGSGSGSGVRPSGAEAAGGQTGVILVPDNLSISINALAKRVRYHGIDLDSCKGQLVIDSGKLKLNNTGFTLIGTPVVMNAMYQSLSPQRAQFDYRIKATEFDVKRAYKEIKLFHDLASSASKAEGLISLDYQLSGKLDGNMRPVYPSLKGGGVLSVKKVKMKGMKLFGAASKESGKDINDPDLSKVELKSSINNNLITIPRTRMKVSVFKLRMEGQASFEGRLNLRLRIGLPPFGVIGIPLTITGTEDNPKVKVGKGTDKDDLEETGDKE